MFHPTDSINHCSVASNLEQKKCSDFKGIGEEKNIIRHKSLLAKKYEQAVSLTYALKSLSLSGCFYNNNDEVHCSNCHKNITSENVNKYIRGKVSSLDEFHYSDCNGLVSVTTQSLNNAAQGTSVASKEKEIIGDTVDGRIATFPADWIHAAYLPARHMARAGFMYNHVQNGSNDSVKCCYCAVRVHNWTPKGNPFVKHIELNPLCPYLRNIEFKKGLKDLVEEKQKNSEKVGQKVGQPVGQPVCQPVCQPVGEKQSNKSQGKKTSSQRSDSKNVIEKPLTALSNQKKASALSSELEKFSKLDYGDFNSRMQSYASLNWIKGLAPSPIDMAGAGFFFTDLNDIVECFSCQLRVEGWRSTYDPYLTHRKKRSNCAYVLSGIFKSKMQAFIEGHKESQASRGMKKSTIESNPSPARSLVNAHDTLNEREKSFSSGGSLFPANTMAEAGFYSIGIGDTVKCAHCAFFVSGWSAAHNPFEAHLKGCTTGRHCPLIEGEVFKSGRKKFEEQRAAQASGGDKQNQATKSLTYTQSDSGYHAESSEAISKSSADTTPEYTIFSSRLDSFNSSSCPQNIKNKACDMAETGFFYTGNKDEVKCIFCDLGLNNWMIEDVPKIEHAKHSVNCAYLKKNSGGEKQNEATKSPSDIKSNMGQRSKNPAAASKSSADTKPASPDYSILRSRLDSFNAPLCPQVIKNKAHDMAETGLFYTGSDEVKCAFCNIRLNDWQLEDVPKIEHARHSPNCHFIKENEKKKVAIESKKQRQPIAVATKAINKTTLKQTQGSSEKSTDPLAIDDRSLLENETTKALREMGYLDKDILTATKKALSKTKGRIDVVSILNYLN